MAAHEDLTVLDARRDDERASDGVRGSLHIPIHELSGRIEEIPAGEVWVYCGYDDPDTGADAVGLHTQPVPA